MSLKANIEALFTIAKSWKNPRCSSVGDWTNRSPPTQLNIIQRLRSELLKGTFDAHC